LPEADVIEQCDVQDLIFEYKTLLTDAVRRQLVADVPIGILLSGGVDSSLITAIASHVSVKPVKTFTISFPEHAGYNEDAYAQIVADHFGTEHTVLPASAVSIEILAELARQYDEPMADSSLIPTFLVSRLIRQYATVAIGGDGGDELFGGYPHYSWLTYQEMARKFIPSWTRSLIAYGATHCLPIGFRGRNHLLGMKGETQNSFAFINYLFDHHARPKLFLPLSAMSSAKLREPEQLKAATELSGKTVIQRTTAIDFMFYLADNLLVKVDRASMLASLEVRAPFLDYRLIEFAFRKVPDSLRVHGNKRKILSRLLARDLLPKKVDLKRKQGFTVPLAEWLKGEWGDYMKSILLDTDTWFNEKLITTLFKGQEYGLVNSQRLFSLMMFELWRKEYRISCP